MDPRIVNAVEGDGDALAELLFDCYDRLHAHINKRIGADLRALVDPDDILQEAYSDAFANISTFQAKSEQGFYRWLETIAEHRLLDTIRGLRAKKRGGEFKRIEQRSANREDSFIDLIQQLSTGSVTPGSQVARREAVRALQIQLASLPNDYRQVIMLRDIEGLSRVETARRMGRSEDEVRGLLYRARKKLRASMGRSSLWFSKK